VPAGHIAVPQIKSYNGVYLETLGTQYLAVLGWRDHSATDVPTELGTVVWLVRIPEVTP
jgi:hypothetical protein